MKTSNKVILGIVATVGISMAAIGGTAKYYFGNGFNGKAASFITERISDELALNGVQKEKLNIVKQTLLAKVKTMKSDKAAHKEKVLQLFSGNTLDRSAAIQMVTDKTNSIQIHAPEVVDVLADFYDALDTTQQGKVQTLVKEKMERGHRRGFRHRGFSH